MLKLTFVDQSGVSPEPVSIGFFCPPGKTMSVTNNKTGSQIPALDALPSGGSFPFAGNWIPLADLSGGVSVTSFSGRIYAAYGPAWQVLSANYEPGQAVTDANFYLRYDKLEITFTGQPADVANLTSIDYWSIPMTLETFLSTGASPTVPVDVVSGLLGGATAQDVYDTLRALTTPPISGLPGLSGNDGAPLPALVPGSYVQFSPDSPAPGGSFARILGPSSYAAIFPAQGIPVMPYDLFTGYLTQLLTQFGPGTTVGAVIPGLGNGVFANISGWFAGVGPDIPATGPSAAQDYALSASIDANLDITLTGTLSQVAGTATLLFKKQDLLNPQGIYGGNCQFYLNGSSTPEPQPNNVYGWVSADLFAGLSIGAIGSTAEAAGTGMVFGQLASQKWFSFPVAAFYSKLQLAPVNPPGPANYNQWSAALMPLSNAYAFAYTDRFARVFARLDPALADTLQVTLLPGAVTAPA